MLKCSSFLLALLCFASSVVFAQPIKEKSLTSETTQSDPEQLESPAGPEFPPPNATPLRIDSLSLGEVREMVLPELVPLVQSGELVLPVVRSLQFEWRPDDDWLRVSQIKVPLQLQTKEGAVLTSLLDRGYPFRTGEWEKELQEPKELAVKLLWNTQAHLWAEGGLRAEFDLVTLEGGQILTEFSGGIERVYPARFSDRFKTQLLRERTFLRVAEGLPELRWLTFRFVPAREDMFWSLSPALGAVRRATGANRSDSFFDTVVSLEDFFTWSGKVQSSEAVYAGTTTALLPFRYTDLLERVEDADGCVTAVVPDKERRDGYLSRSLEWNFESRAFLEGAGWLPTHVRYAPRKVHRIRLFSEDPYSQYGSEVLYLDADSQLPIYKIVYDSAGELWKIVFSVFSEAASKDNRKKAVFPEFTVVLDRKLKRSSIVDYQNVRHCPVKDAEERLAEFQPTKLVPPEPKEESPEVEGGSEEGPSASRRVPATDLLDPDLQPG